MSLIKVQVKDGRTAKRGPIKPRHCHIWMLPPGSDNQLLWLLLILLAGNSKPLPPSIPLFCPGLNTLYLHFFCKATNIIISGHYVRIFIRALQLALITTDTTIGCSARVRVEESSYLPLLHHLREGFRFLSLSIMFFDLQLLHLDHSLDDVLHPFPARRLPAV